MSGLLLALSLGCGATPTPSPTPPVDPQAVLLQSAERVSALDSGAFVLEHRTGATVLLPGVEMTRVYGEVEIPGRFRMTVEAEAGGVYAEIQIAQLGEQTYMTNFITGQWQAVPREALPFDFSDLGNTLAGIIRTVQSPVLVATEELNGIPSHRIRGQVKSEDMAGLVRAAATGYDVTLEFWVDQAGNLPDVDDRDPRPSARPAARPFLPRQVLITGRVVAADTDDTVRVFTLEDREVEVEVTLPQ